MSNKHTEAFFVAPGFIEVPNIRGGGIENNIFHLASHSRNICTILSPKPREKPMHTYSTSSRITYSLLSAVPEYPLPPYLCLSNMLVYFSMVLLYTEAALYVLRKRRQIKAVIVFDKFLGVLPLIIAKVLNVTGVYMEYNIWPWTYSGSHRSIIFSIQAFFGRAVARLASVVTVNSPSIGSGMIRLGIPSEKIRIVPTGIDLDFSSKETRIGHNDSPFTVLYAGRLVEERGAHMLIDIIRHITRLGRGINLRIAGGGPYLEDLRRFVKTNRLEEVVDVYGQVDRRRVMHLMRTSHVTLFISCHENYGSLAMLECMAVGCPVIATNVGNTSMIITHTVNGILSSTRAESIADAIESLEKNRTLLRSMSKMCLETVKAYSWTRAANRFDRAINSISWNIAKHSD